MYILDKEQRKKCIIVFLLTFIGALFETLGVSAIIPFIQSIMTPQVLFSNKYAIPLIELFHVKEPFQLIVLMGVGIALAYIIKNVYLILLTYIQSRFRTRFLKDVSTELLINYIARPYTFFLNTNSSEVVQGINGDSHCTYDILDTIFKLMSECLTVLLIAIFIIYTDPFMAAFILFLAIGVFFAVTFTFKRKISVMGDESREASEKQYRHIYQAVNGIKEIKVMQRATCFVNRYRGAAETTRRTSLGLAVVQGIPERLIEAICITGLIAAVCIKIGSGTDVNTFVPQLAAFAVAAFRILPSISRITGYTSMLVFYRKYLDISYQNFAHIRKYQKQNTDVLQMTQDNDDKWEHMGAFKQVTIEHVSWKYNEEQDFVLNNLEMVIKRGESVAFIGTSGAGKTTLADVFLGLLPPQNGTIKIDGMDIFSNLEMWSKVVGYVPQTVFLTDDTIRANVSFGIPDEEIDDEKVWDALEQAQIKQFVGQLPDGINTIVGERGVKFSGGQRQRIAIARALYNEPQILVLDEATSALDNETEEAVMEAIDALQGKKTLIIVAHRLSTIRNCDKIYEIKEGKALLKDKKEVFG